MLPGPPLLAQDRHAARSTATVTELKYKVNVNTLEHLAAKTLELNEIGVCNLSLDQPIAFDPYDENRDTGGFILIDRLTNATVGAGMIHFALRRAQNIHWQALDVNKAARAALKGQKPAVLWFTGLSGAGKSTIANLVEKQLHALGPAHLPARRRQRPPRPQPRPGLHRRRPRREHPPRRRGREADGRRRPDRAGVVHLAVPRRAADGARAVRRGRVHRGVRRHAARGGRAARRQGPVHEGARGELKNFTGIDSPYEAPEHPEICVDTTRNSAEESAAAIVEKLRIRGGSGRRPERR